MSPGRAWSALTTWRLSCLASACWTQVCTAAQPVPFILWPECSSDHVTKLAHHGLPGPTFASARYLSTSAPVLTPVSCTPIWVCATCSAEAPRLLAPCAVAAAAAAPSARGPARGGWTPREVPLCLSAAAVAAMNGPELPGAGATGATGAPGGAGA